MATEFIANNDGDFGDILCTAACLEILDCMRKIEILRGVQIFPVSKVSQFRSTYQRIPFAMQ